MEFEFDNDFIPLGQPEEFQPVETEFDKYLKESFTGQANNKIYYGNPMVFWSSNRYRYPKLYLVARNFVIIFDPNITKQ